MKTRMTQPSHPYDINQAWARVRVSETMSFTLSPELWGGLVLPQPLRWYRVKFEEASAREVPNNLIGVYSFVVEPGIAGLNLAYLMYVGKTVENFRTRFRKYLKHQVEEHTQRQAVQHMLRTWSDNLSFYYAPIADRDLVCPVEDALIIAFKPSVPRAYPARVRGRFKALDLLLRL